MNNDSNDTFACDLENRLDAFFEGTPPQKPTPDNTEEQPVPEATDILKGLKSAVLAMDWEITDDVLNDFIHQVDALTDPFSDDRINRTLLKLLTSLGRYLLAQKSMAHPDTTKRIMAVYTAIEESVSNEVLSKTDREALLVEEIRQFKRLKKEITKPTAVSPVSKSNPRPSLEKAPGIEAVIKSIDEFRLLMASELSAIRSELEQLRKNYIQNGKSMKFAHALTRRPENDMAAGITTSNLGLPDLDKALEQFDAYVQTLTLCGLAVTVLDPLEGFPDAHFVEDTAVVLPEVAIITHPGAASRRGEVDSILVALSSFRQTVQIQPPGTIDGGDVLMVGTHFFIGLSERTNETGARQLGDIVSPFGYTWTTVPVAAGLHFKSSVNAVGNDTLLTTATFSNHQALADFNRIVLSGREEYAGNTLMVNGHLIMPKGFSDTKKKLQTLGNPIIELDMSEFRKMDGGLTCLSLRF